MAQSLQCYLNGGDTLARLHDHAARLRRLQSVLESALPPHLSGSCTVANFKEGTLVLLARNGASAAKLRQSVPSLQQDFTRAGIVIIKIQIKIQLQPTPSQLAVPQARTLGDGGRKSIEALCATLPPDAPLRQSLEKLLSHNKT